MNELGKIIKEISNSSNLNEKNVIVETKNALREKDLDAYSKWREDEFNVNHLFYGQDTLLHLAAENGSIEIVEALIKNGANVNAVDQFEKTPLHHAASFGEVEVMKCLIENGANVNAVDELEDTPLLTATSVSPGCLTTAIVKILIENGADVNAVSGVSEATPLHSIATLSDCVDTVRALIKNGANVNALDFYENTPLHLAAEYGCLEIVQTLIKNGADPNAANEYGEYTPLHLAAQNNHLEVVKYLTDNGADINAKNIKRKVPLDCAREKGYEEIVGYLTDTMLKMPHNKDKVLQACQDDSLDNDISLTDCHAFQEKKIDKRKEEKPLKKKSGCLIQSHRGQQKKIISHYLPNVEIKPVRQGLYLPSFEGRGVKVDGKCVAITRGLTQALFLQDERSFLSNLETSAEIYERIAQGKQISQREEREVFAFSKLLTNFERQLVSAKSSLPSNLIHTKGYKTLDDLSNYIAGIKDNFAVHLVTSNHVVAIYRTGNNYAYFDSNAAFISELKSVDQLMKIVEKAVKFAGYKVEEKGVLVEHFDVDKANNLLSSEDRQILAKEIKTERQLLAKQDEKFGPIKIYGQELSRVQLNDFGTKINVKGSVPLLINALSSKEFQEHLARKEVSMSAREYLDHLKSENMEVVVQAAKIIPFIGSKFEIEEAKQTRKPKKSSLIKGTINFILAAVSLANIGKSKSQFPRKIDNKPETYLNDPIVDNQLQKSLGH